MSRKISDHQMTLLSDYVAGWLGLHFPKKRWPDLQRNIGRAAGELGFQDATACISWLLSTRPSESQAEVLACHLTIGETYFFREQQSLEILENRILPDLISSRRGKDQRLRIWSAGCSTGEEPYSLAIMIKRLIPDLKEWNVTILATDINPQALDKAAQGVYGEWSFRGVHEAVKNRHVTRRGDGRYELPYATRKMVSFAVLNLADDPYPSLSNNTNAMDIIFCRNVLMYFEERQQRRVIENFHHALLDGGWLVVSPCETSPAFSTRFETVTFPGVNLYRKGDHQEKVRSATLPFQGMALSAPIPLPGQSLSQPEYSAPPPPASVLSPAAENVKVESQAALPSAYDEALILYRQGLYGEATERLSGLLDNAEADIRLPCFGKGTALLAQILANQGELNQALEWSLKAIASDKLNAELYYLRATILQELGESAQATAALKKTLYLDQNFILAHFDLGTLAQRHGKAKEADRHFDNALSLLGACQADEPVPGSDGLSAGRLSEIIGSMRAGLLR